MESWEILGSLPSYHTFLVARLCSQLLQSLDQRAIILQKSRPVNIQIDLMFTYLEL